VLFDFVKKCFKFANPEEVGMMFKEMKEKYLKVCTENLALKEKLKDLE